MSRSGSPTPSTAFIDGTKHGPALFSATTTTTSSTRSGTQVPASTNGTKRGTPNAPATT